MLVLDNANSYHLALFVQIRNLVSVCLSTRQKFRRSNIGTVMGLTMLMFDMESNSANIKALLSYWPHIYRSEVLSVTMELRATHHRTLT